MKAAVVTRLGAPLEIHDIPIPTPGPGQALVRIEACGVCHTDIHAARGEWPAEPKDPLIPGHEGVGVIEQVARVVTSSRRLEDVNECFEDVLSGKAPARLVFEMTESSS
ncbi:alcohol dehydrogenase catalytic domain-containing protein [Ornithinimicrobium sp. LYQ92]|uniref:alcohol dehydrogenase catalytic domain-containing protein n=1 Tax=Serinicoccus sp. LYQ92 TaxID=3378798 RepID=UPI0038549EA0